MGIHGSSSGIKVDHDGVSETLIFVRRELLAQAVLYPKRLLVTQHWGGYIILGTSHSPAHLHGSF